MELKKDLEKDNLDNLATLAIRLARTSGNIFQIDNDGKVSSVLKESVHDLMEICAPRTHNYIETWHRR
ncbi:hypothetical protein GLOIN_2v1877208 [Rhizophagus irregularis DAOM 181602=DAOM 197198]|nr:hypothetical protein GLOIN_2v1877208 [Rhizophagus irregularis DAOM 181602=DAOM 197198]